MLNFLKLPVLVLFAVLVLLLSFSPVQAHGRTTVINNNGAAGQTIVRTGFLGRRVLVVNNGAPSATVFVPHRANASFGVSGYVGHVSHAATFDVGHACGSQTFFTPSRTVILSQPTTLQLDTCNQGSGVTYAPPRAQRAPVASQTTTTTTTTVQHGLNLVCP